MNSTLVQVMVLQISIIFGLLFHIAHSKIPITGYLDEEVRLACEHSFKSDSDIRLIGWQYNRDKDPIATFRLNQDFPLEVLDVSFSGRVKINFPNGDLTIQPSKWTDQGDFQCFLLTAGGVSIDAAAYKLQINVIPEEVLTRCAVKSKSYASATKLCSELQDVQSISCSATSNPPATITWIKRPQDCKENETNYCNLKEDMPKVCASQLDRTCDGTYQCQATFDDGVITKNVLGDQVIVKNGHSSGQTSGKDKSDKNYSSDNGSGNSVFMWKLIVGLVVGFILLIVVVISLIYYRRISKRFKDPSIAKDKNEPSCFLVVCCPCMLPKQQDGRRSTGGNNHVTFENQRDDNDPSRQRDDVPLQDKNNRRSGAGDYHSDSDDESPRPNKYNSVSERKQIRPEIFQAVEAAKALMDAPETARCNFMVQTMGGTKYKFEVEKNRSTDNLQNAGSGITIEGGGGGGDSGRDEFLASIKGPVMEKKVKIDVEDVD